MLTAIRPTTAAASFQPKSAPTAPATETAAEPLDLSTIDTAQKAVLLPCLNPAMLSVVISGMVISSMSNGPATASLKMALNDVPGNLVYTFNPQNPQQAVTASGELGGLPYRESWAVDQDKRQITLTASLGETQVDLKMNAGEKGVLARGKVGDLAITQVISGESDMSSVTSNGKIGTQSLSHQIKVSETEDRGYQIAVSGQLGQDSLEESVTLAKGEQSALKIEGQGNLAGTKFSMSGELYAGR